MSSNDYTSVPSTGKLKLKGVTDGRIDKKKKKRKLNSDDTGTVQQDHSKNAKEDSFEDNSVILRKLQEEDAEITRSQNTKRSPSLSAKQDEAKQHLQTEAERRFEEQRRKRLEERLKREGVKTHKQRVEELNRYLSGLSEHHDMPKIGPG